MYDETRINGGGENSDAVDVQGGSGAPGGPEESVDDPYEYENKFPPDMLPSPDWAQDDDDWNEAMKYRVYECDEEDGALLEGRSRAAVERGGGRDEGADASPASRSGTLQGNITPEILSPPSSRFRERNSAPSPPVTEPSRTDATPSPDRAGPGSTTKGRKRGLNTGEDRDLKRQRQN